MTCRRASRLARAILAATAGLAAAAAAAQDVVEPAPPREHAAVEPAATPEAAVETLQDGLVEVAAAYGDADFDVRYRQLAPIVAATHDLPYIAELTIRREWKDLDQDRRRRFVDAFARLSISTYASRFRNLEAGMFAIDGSEPLGDGRAEVRATLTTPDGDMIPFEYVLHETGAGWKIINILADNVSDLALKRAEYRRALESGTIDDLIADLEKQAAAAEE